MYRAKRRKTCDSNRVDGHDDDSEISAAKRKAQPLFSSFEQELSSEIASYNQSATKKGTYQPGSLSRRQLARAASEFYKRWKESEECFERGYPEPQVSPFVLVSRGCSDFPSGDMEESAIEHLEGVVDRLWYYLSDKGDLFITKLNVDLAYGVVVGLVVTNVGAYAHQCDRSEDGAFDIIMNGGFGLSGGEEARVGEHRGGRSVRSSRIAPSCVLQLSYSPILSMRAPLVVEIEVGSRSPKH